MNPVLQKDIVGLLRLKRVAAIHFLFVAVLAALVLLTWPQGGIMAGTFSIGKESPAGPASDDLLMGLVLGQLVLLILLVPGIASVALTSEREGNTLEMLYASRLKPLSIILGKIGIAIGYPVILLVSGLPFVAMLGWRGEVRPAQLAEAYFVLTLSSVYLSILCLAISAYCRQSATALVVAYVVVLVTCGGVLVPAAIMLDTATDKLLGIVLHYIRGLSPLAAALSLLKPRLNDFGGAGRNMLPVWQIFVPMASLATLVCIALIVLKLRKAPSSSEGFGAPTGGTMEARSLGRKLLYLIDPKKKRKPLGRGNPLLGKERRTSNLRSGRWMIRIFYASLFLSLGMAVMSLYGGTQHEDLLRYVAQVLVAFQIALVTLVIPSLSSATVSSEHENGTFELLRLTPLRAGQIFWGKLLPAFLPAVLPIVALVPAYATVCYVNLDYIPRVLMILPIVLLTVLMFSILGLTCSAFLSNTARATVVAYLIAAGMVVLPALVWWAGVSGLVPRNAAKYVGAISPLVMSLSLLPTERGGGQDVQALIYELRDYHCWFMGGLCVLMLIMSRIRLAVMLRQG
jgi:ABC-type transport system involved in multi-copper enzyme maturation permease subunit